MKDDTKDRLSPPLPAGLSALTSHSRASAIDRVNLRCEHLADPPGIDTVRPRQCCHWKVRVWDRAGVPSAWSAPVFEVGSGAYRFRNNN